MAPTAQRRPLGELKISRNETGARAGVPKSAPGKGGKLSAGVFGAGAQRAGAPGKRPATAQPARAALAGGLLQPLAVPVRPRGASAHGARGDLVIEGTGAVGKDDSGLSAELMRILEERSLKPQLHHVSPHKEAAERASEQCPRRPVQHCTEASSGKIATVAAAAKPGAASRITPCAPREPKASTHARKTYVAVKRTSSSARPRTAAPAVREQTMPRQTGAKGAQSLQAEHRVSAMPANRRNSDTEECQRNHPASCTALSNGSASVHSSKERNPSSSANSLASNDRAAGSVHSSREHIQGQAADSPVMPCAHDPELQRPGDRKGGAKSRSTIADLIARFRNGPPQRPEDRKAAGPAAAVSLGGSASMFWWRKNTASEEEPGDHAEGAGGIQGARDIDSCEVGKSCGSSDGSQGSETGNKGSQNPRACYERARQSFDAATRNSADSLCGSEMDGVRQIDNSDQEVASSVSATATVNRKQSDEVSRDSIDARASLLLRQASCTFDSSFQSRDSSLVSGASEVSRIESPPGSLNAQLDEAEDLLEQWRSQRRCRKQGSASARPAAASQQRSASRDRTVLAPSWAKVGAHGGEVDSAVSRIRRRLGMGGEGGGANKGEAGAYARRMREMTSRLSSESEGEATAQEHMQACEQSREGPDSLVKWRDGRTVGKQRRGTEATRSVSPPPLNDLPPSGTSPTSSDANESFSSVASSGNGNRDRSLRHVAPTSPSHPNAGEKDASFHSHHIATPRSSATSIISKTSAPSPNTPREDFNVCPASGREGASITPNVNSQCKSQSSSPRSISPRPSGMSSAQRLLFSGAMANVVENMLFSVEGRHVIDKVFLAHEVESEVDVAHEPRLHSQEECTGFDQVGGNLSWEDEQNFQRLASSPRPDVDDVKHGDTDNLSQENKFHFREVGYVRWDSRDDEHSKRNTFSPLAGDAGPGTASPITFAKTHISIPSTDDQAGRGSPWNKTGTSDDMPRWSHTVWSDGQSMCKTAGGGANASLSHTHGTHNTSIVEHMGASFSHTQDYVGGVESAVIEDVDENTSIIDEVPNAKAHSPEALLGVSTGGEWRRRRRSGASVASVEEDFCILQDLDMADAETGEVFVDRGGGLRGGVSPKDVKACTGESAKSLLTHAHGWDQDVEVDPACQSDADEDDAIVRALRQRMLQITTEIETLDK